MATAIPQAKKATEKELVEDFAEAASLAGFKVTRHAVSENHEREETTLTVTFVRNQGGQGVLKLAKPEGEPEEGLEK